MSGTKQGSIKLRQTMIAKHGSEDAWKAHMRSLASIGGKNGSGEDYKKGGSRPGGFAHPNSDPSASGKKGGLTKKRNRDGKV